MNKPKLIILVGPPGSGKTTYCKELQKDDNISGIFRINQDEQAKQHFYNFLEAVKDKMYIVVDRMNFNKEQRDRYLKPAKEAGYETEIIVFHESKETCLKRCINRIGHHETILTPEDAHRAINFFFSKYERPTLDEADTVTFKYPDKGLKLDAIISDIDGTMADIEHRQHFVRDGKKDWKNFLHPRNVEQDVINTWCRSITNSMRGNHIIIMCSGRVDTLRDTTKTWLEENKVFHDYLFMRPRDDYRQDSIIKEIILDFEILTRVNPVFVLDDRDQVVEMWRRRGLTCLQCAEGNF